MENKKKYKLKSIHRKILADTHTPVSVYLKIRDQFPHSLLLESSDYDARANNFSYICFNPIASISISDGNIDYNYPDGLKYSRGIDPEDNVPKADVAALLPESIPFPAASTAIIFTLKSFK